MIGKDLVGLPNGWEKNPPANTGDSGSIPGLGRFPEEGNGNPLHILVWRIPGTEEPGGLKSMGSKRVGYNSVTKGQLRFYILKTGNEEANHFLFLPEKHA